MNFELAARIANDTVPLGDLPLSRVLLMNDARYPWLLLVPRRPGLREIIDLPRPERISLMDEIALASEALKTVAKPAKINVAALGNIVTQLHVHVLGRDPGDAAWPGPVWGIGQAVPYEDDALARQVAAMRQVLALG